jgi:DNA-binding response OmpR family regulator
MASIMIVDDDLQVRMLISEVMRLAGHEIRETDNSKAAIHQYRESPVDLVIMDIMMPKGDGVEGILALRRQFADSKILAMTGEEQGLWGTDLLAAALLLGAVGALRKPFDVEELVAAVTTVLTGKPYHHRVIPA